MLRVLCWFNVHKTAGREWTYWCLRCKKPLKCPHCGEQMGANQRVCCTPPPPPPLRTSEHAGSRRDTRG